jgi:DNA repair protein RecN (Recombination protein N)
MLEELSIVNFALIERLSVRFDRGLNLLTGETGAGKSILIGALGFLLGGKVETQSIRSGADETSVSGVLCVEGNAEALAWLSAREIQAEDGTVVVRRTFKATGRGNAYIQGVPVTRPDLAEFSAFLVDMHGQHEHQSLVSTEAHRRFLDRYAGIEAEVAAFSQAFAELSQKKRLLESSMSSERDRAQQIELLSFAVAEIEAAKLRIGEEETLEAESQKLSQHEKLFSSVETAHELLSASQEGPSALALARKARAGLDAASAIDDELSPLGSRLADAYFELEDIARSIASYASSQGFDPARQEAVESRLKDIHKLKKKYGGSVEEVLSYLGESREKLEGLKHWDDDRAGLEADVKERESGVHRAALALRAKRQAAAALLKSKIEAVIRSLGMPKASFTVSVRNRESEAGKPLVGQFGADTVEFLITTNQGEGEKPLAKVASGGELSRVMLALKTVLSQADSVSCLIFDEIDTGIGGEVALSVGEHLKTLAKNKQVLCITHLATVAVRADNHLKVEKGLEGGRTVTRLRRIDGRERVAEIARMLSGDSSESASLAHATELLKKYGTGA